MLKFRDLPCEPPIDGRAPNRSISVTWRPRRARCHAVADPIAPPPTTTVSRRAAMRPVSGRGREGLRDHVEGLVEELVGDRERGQEAQHVAPGAAGEGHDAVLVAVR